MITRQNSKRDPLGQLRVLLQSLPTTLSADEVHRLRVSIKRTRAWLKLCRAVTGSSPEYEQLVANLRELSHILSAQRDRDVVLQTLEKLVKKYPGKKAQRLGSALSQLIAQEPVKRPDITTLDSRIAQICEQLPTFTCLTLPRQTQVSVMQHAFTKVCKLGDSVLGSATCADLHAWRKRVKTLFYQTEIVEGALSGQNKVQLRLEKLGSRLGEVHDLCVLETIVVNKAALLQPPLAPAPVFRRIQRERHRLIKSCHKHYRHLCT